MKKITQFINPFTDFGFKKLFGEEEKYRDLKNVTDTAFRDGELKGKLEGKIEGKIESILNGHEAGLPLEMLVKISKLPEQQVLEIIRQGSKPTK
jgi:predicted transposase YdaD